MPKRSCDALTIFASGSLRPAACFAGTQRRWLLADYSLLLLADTSWKQDSVKQDVIRTSGKETRQEQTVFPHPSIKVASGLRTGEEISNEKTSVSSRPFGRDRGGHYRRSGGCGLGRRAGQL